MRETLVWLTAPWRRRSVFDLPLGIGGTAIIYWLAPHSILATGDTTALASSIIVASAAFGSLAVTPIAIVLALTPGPRLRSLMGSQLGRVRVAMAWAVVINLVAVSGGILDLITDSSAHPEQVMRWFMMSAEIASLLAIARLLWFFVSLLQVNEADRVAPEPESVVEGPLL